MDVIRPMFSWADLRQLPDDGKRYEIVEGDLAVSPSPNRKHQRVVQALYRWFRGLEEQGAGQVYTAPFDVVLDIHNIVEPDLVFVRSPGLDIVTEANIQGAPDCVVEVLSPGTRDRDLGVKVHLYARFRVPEYWALDPEMETVTLYRLTNDGYERTGPFRRDEQFSTRLIAPPPMVSVAQFFSD